MWSSNLFLAGFQNLNKEKRERQPNWTESEKQLLLCLTEMHKSVLENKGSDTMTVKRKSEAWDEIALRMKAAGFNRSKERLKQQLGRIRAAEAKKMKSSMEFYINENQVDHSNNPCSSPTALPLEEQKYIKSENRQIFDVNDCIERELKVNPCVFKPNFKSYAIVNAAGKENYNNEDSKIFDGMHFKLQNVQSLAKSYNNVDRETKLNSCCNEEKGLCAADVTSSISCSDVHFNMDASTSFESNQKNGCGNNEDAGSPLPPEKSQKLQRKKRWIRRRANSIRSSFYREQSLRKLYAYRIAFERARLRNLKLQQKHDCILYRKDIEIQNLKLQILESLKNQQREANNYNF